MRLSNAQVGEVAVGGGGVKLADLAAGLLWGQGCNSMVKLLSPRFKSLLSSKIGTYYRGLY